MNHDYSRHRSVPHTAGVTAHSDGGPVIAILPNGNPRVTLEEHPASKQPDGFARNRIRFHIACEECSGTGRYTLDGGNNPYARIYECEACEGAGVWADDEERAA